MGTREEEWRLRRHVAEVGRARGHVRRFCAEMDGDVRATAQLLTSELVTNAMEHGSGAIVLRLAATDHTLRVEVADDSVQEPKLQAENTESLSGRGLRLVDALASGWGVAPATSGGGKVVWFTLRVPPMH